MDAIWTILTAVITSAATSIGTAIGATAFTCLAGMVGFWKLYLESRVQESVKDEFAAKWQQRQADYEKELEGWKAGYQKAIDENRIGFTRFHEEQALLLKNLYTRLIRLHRMAYNISDGDHERRHQNFIDFEREFSETKDIYYANEILVPESLGDEVLNVLNNQYMLQLHTRLSADSLNFDMASKSLDKVDDIQRNLEKLMPIVRRQFACLLRGESISS